MYKQLIENIVDAAFDKYRYVNVIDDVCYMNVESSSEADRIARIVDGWTNGDGFDHYVVFKVGRIFQ